MSSALPTRPTEVTQEQCPGIVETKAACGRLEEHRLLQPQERRQGLDHHDIFCVFWGLVGFFFYTYMKSVMIWVITFPPNSCVQSLVPSLAVFEGGLWEVTGLRRL